MTNLSRPLLGLLVGAIALFAVWTLALKPHSSSSAPAAKTTAAPAALTVSATKPGTTTPAVSAAKPATTTPLSPKPAIHSATPARRRLDIVTAALGAHKVV